MSLLSLVFANPMMLAALVALPAIWWLLRLTPPRPVTEAFPPLRILASVLKREETPSKSPWWLTLLRMLMAAAVILAVADPVLNPRANTLSAHGPLVLFMDNGWATAPNWERRVNTADALISDAESRDLPVSILFTADREHNAVPTSPDEARNRLAAAAPQPLTPNRKAAFTALSTALKGSAPGTIAFLSDGVASGENDVMADLASLSPAELRLIGGSPEAVAITASANEADAMTVSVSRLDTSGARVLPLTAYDIRGRAIANGTVSFNAGEATARGAIAAPFELRNDFSRIGIDDQATAGGTYLLDDGFRRRRVALLSGEVRDQSQPLLSPLYYINRALAPYADLVQPNEADLAVAIPELLSQKPSMLIMADIGHDQHRRLLRQKLGYGDGEIGFVRLHEIGIGGKRPVDVIKRREQRLRLVADFAAEERHAAAAETVVEQIGAAGRRLIVDADAGEIVAQLERSGNRASGGCLAGIEGDGTVGDGAAADIVGREREDTGAGCIEAADGDGHGIGLVGRGGDRHGFRAAADQAQFRGRERGEVGHHVVFAGGDAVGEESNRAGGAALQGGGKGRERGLAVRRQRLWGCGGKAVAGFVRRGRDCVVLAVGGEEDRDREIAAFGIGDQRVGGVHPALPVRCGRPAIVHKEHQRAVCGQRVGARVQDRIGDGEDDGCGHQHAQQRQPPRAFRGRFLALQDACENAQRREGLGDGAGRRQPQQPPDGGKRNEGRKHHRIGKDEGKQAHSCPPCVARAGMPERYICTATSASEARWSVRCGVNVQPMWRRSLPSASRRAK